MTPNSIPEPTMLTVDEETRQRFHADAARAEELLSGGAKLSEIPDAELVGLAAVRDLELVLLTAELARRRHASAN